MPVMFEGRCNRVRGLLACGAVGLAATLAGCRSVPTKPASTGPEARAGASENSDSGVVQTEFRREVPAENRVGVHMELARAYELRGAPEGAIYEYQKAIEAADAAGGLFGGKIPAETKALAHRRMAAALDRMGRFGESKAHYREALRLAPNDPKVWNDAGYSEYLQRRWTDAERKLKTAARLAPNDPRVQTNLGLCLAAAGKTDEALEALSKAGGPAVGHANLAYILAAMDRPDEARRHYEIALQFQPNLEPAKLALARLDAPRGGAIAAAPSDREVKLSGGK